jgi:hypothetical protein
MAEKILKISSVIFGVLFLFYLAIPNSDFPAPPLDSLQSHEPADSENPLRRAYFTNYSRAEVLVWYKGQFERPTVLGIKIPAYLLNYPPENAQTIIRDQTRSTFLQEVVHPFRESVFINGFEPTNPKDAIFIENRVWRQKITVRYIPSLPVVRLGVFAGMIYLTAVLFKQWRSIAGKRK